MDLMDYSLSPWLLILIGLAALLYSSVGYGGASGYLAAMALFGLDPEFMKPTALTMNVFVASLVLFRLARAGYFRWSLFWPFAVGSVPLAFLGGAVVVTASIYRVIVGGALLLAAARMFWESVDRDPAGSPAPWVAVPIGAALGFVSGLTGVGGGIFLSPLLLLLGWANMRTSAALAAGFILITSAAGVLGHMTVGAGWPSGLPALVGAALLGALVGSELAVRRMHPVRLRKVLGVILLIAAGKMFHAA